MKTLFGRLFAMSAALILLWKIHGQIIFSAERENILFTGSARF